MDRRAYIEMLQTRQKELAADFQKKKGQLERQKIKGIMKGQQQMDEMEKKLKDIRMRTDTLRESGDDTWGNLQEKMEKKMDELTKSIANLTSSAKDES